MRLWRMRHARHLSRIVGKEAALGKPFKMGGLMHAVIRRYRVRLGTMEQAARHAEKWFLPLVRDIPGFIAFYLVAAEESVLAALGLFETAAGAEAAVALAGDWFRAEWGSFRPLPPEVISGEVVAQATAHGRPVVERRQVAERRRAATFVGTSAIERRNGVDRRVGVELQAVV